MTTSLKPPSALYTGMFASFIDASLRIAEPPVSMDMLAQVRLTPQGELCGGALEPLSA